jgi:hypothetical protein
MVTLALLSGLNISPLNFADEENKMADEILTRTRYGEAAHARDAVTELRAGPHS